MQLTPEDWRRTLALLDEALALAPSARPAWLEGLDAGPPQVRAALRQLLQDRGAIETADFLHALPPLHAADGLVAGQRVGPWDLLRELGRGGMASVWLARRSDGAHRREVALKLPHRLQSTRGFLKRFAFERAILSTLDHPCIAQVLDAGSDAGQPWLALEFVDGVPITEHAAQLPLNARLMLFISVLRAVQHAHERLVIHRDLKPANVLVTAQGTPKLLDFGVAKLLAPEGETVDTALTQAGGRAMTPLYASPEQMAGRPLGVASDVYSLGVLLYEVLTGKRPYLLARDTPAALEEAILGADVLPPSRMASQRALRGDIDTLVMKALAKAPAARYTAAAAFADDIERHLRLQPILARPATLPYRLGRWLRRHGWAAGTAAAVGVALTAGLVSTAWQAERADREARRAQATSDFLARLFTATDARENTPEAAARITARDLLERGEKRLATELRDAPEARARLLGVLADMQAGIGQAERAAALRAQGVAVWKQLGGHEIELAEALSQLSTAELAMDRDAAAEQHAREGTAVLQGLHGEAADRARGNLQVRLGDALFRKQADKTDAENAYREAVRLLSKKPVKEDEYPGALNGLAWILASRGDMPEALALMQTMRRERVARWGSDSLMVSAVDRDLAHFYKLSGRLVDAERASDQVMKAMRANAGPGSEEFLTAQFGHAVILQDRGQWAQALALFQATEQAYRLRGDGGFLYRAGSAAAAGECLLELGRFDEARPLIIQAAGELADKAPGQGMSTYALGVLARLQVADGHFHDAAATYARLDKAAAAEPPFRSHRRTRLYLRQVDMALKQGDVVAAQALLARATAAIHPSSPWQPLMLDMIEARQAQIELAQGRVQAALARLDAVRRRQPLAAEPNASPALQADVARLMAQAQQTR